MGTIRKISVIAPCYNEAEVLPEFYRRANELSRRLADREFEFLFVNDGSTDATPGLLDDLAGRDERVKVLHLARNVGHQRALTAGMDHASGDMIVTIDVDLQDPPELIADMCALVEAGHDVVHAQRRRRDGETWFKLFTARLFYALMERLSGAPVVADSADFRAFTRPVLHVINNHREPHRFLRGLFWSVGFREAVLPYDRDARLAGETKYPFRKMLRLAVNGLMSFSSAPIRAIIFASFVLWAASLVVLGQAAYDRFVLQVIGQGFSTVIFLVIAMTALILFCLAIIGAYVGRIFEQGQNRPLYWIRDARNLDWPAGPEQAQTREVRLAARVAAATTDRRPPEAS